MCASVDGSAVGLRDVGERSCLTGALDRFESMAFDAERVRKHVKQFSVQAFTEKLTMYAVKYGGDGVSPALGAGGAWFLADGNLYV